MHRAQHGFTLIELIASLVIIAVTATGILVYIQGLVRGSDQPVLLVHQQVEIRGMMDTLIAQYDDYIGGGATSWADFEDRVNTLADDVDEDLLSRGIDVTRDDLGTDPDGPFGVVGFDVFRVTIQGTEMVLSGLFSQ